MRRLLVACVQVALIALLAACNSTSPHAVATQNPIPTSHIPIDLTASPHQMWIPPAVTDWQWQLAPTALDVTVNAAVYDIDGLSRTASDVATLHAQGRHVICYIDVGSWESFRPDAAQFPTSLLGKTLDGYPNERWLDIRQIALLKPLLEARMNTCAAKGFDAIEPDNVDGYANDTGFPLTFNDQITFNEFIAQEAHARGLSVGLKNDTDQAPQLLPYFDWMLDEQCFEFQECDTLKPFVMAHKAVFEVEYNLPTTAFCPQANALNFNAMLKHLSLDAYRAPCR